MCALSCSLKTDKNRQLLGEAGVAGPLVEVLKTHLQSAAVMEQACWAVAMFFSNGKDFCYPGGEWEKGLLTWKQNVS